MKTLSIIVPAYNIEKYIDKLMGSLLLPEVLHQLEIIIVNDGSGDHTIELAGQYQKKHPDVVKVIDKENGGHGSTINVGIRNVTGKYVKVIDGDDWVVSASLEPLLSYLSRVTSDIVAADYQIYNEKTGKTEHIGYEGVDYERELVFSEICSRIKPIEFHSIFYRTDYLIKNYRELDEHCFYVDTEYTLFPIVHANTISFFRPEVYVYRTGDKEQSVSEQSCVKNIEHLKKVSIHLAEFYEKQGSINEDIRDYVYRRLRIVVDVTYSFALKVPGCKKCRDEIMQFDSEIKQRSKKVYKQVQMRIRLLRIVHFHGIAAVKAAIAIRRRVRNAFAVE